MNLKVLAPFFAFFVLASAQTRKLTISSPIKGQLVLEGSDLPVRVETNVCFVSLFSQRLKLINLLLYYTFTDENKRKHHSNLHRYPSLPSIRRMPRSISGCH